MGRPPKNKDIEIPKKDDATEKENKALKKQIADMQKMLEALTAEKHEKEQPKGASVVAKEGKDDDDYVPEISMNKVVKVMSLFPGGLNLKTSDNSTAQVFRFEEVGEVFPIIYSDLVKILANQRRFFQDGLCMILDKDVVRAHSLTEIYKKMVDGKVINNILTYDVKMVKEIFAGALPAIKQAIVDRVVAIINSNDYYDKNKVSAISDIYGHDIFELASRMK